MADREEKRKEDTVNTSEEMAPSDDLDERELARVGKKSVLRVYVSNSIPKKSSDTLAAQFRVPQHPRLFLLAHDHLGRAMLVCCPFYVPLSIDKSCSVFIFGLRDGGPAGLLYGFIFCWIGYATVVATMGELVSMWPTAGGQYHWTHKLAPDGLKDVLSYVTGWSVRYLLVLWSPC